MLLLILCVSIGIFLQIKQLLIFRRSLSIIITLLKITEEIKGVFLCAIYLFRLSILTKTAT